MNVTLSDEFDFEDYDDSPNDDGNYLALTTSIGSSHESRVYTTPDSDESSEDDCEEEEGLQVAYSKHFEVCTKLKMLNKKLFKKLNVVILENKNLLAKFDESSSIARMIDSFEDCSHKIKSSIIAPLEGSFSI